MGKIAQSLVATFRKRPHDLPHIAEQFTGGMPEDLPSPEELAEQGYDPQHILYIAAHSFASQFADFASKLDAFNEYARMVELAEDEYMPSSPPMSPITYSFFWTWALFDLRFGADRETVGGCLLELMRSMQAPEEMVAALEKYSGSRMGIYEHRGSRADKIRLRELVTGKELLCQSTSGYRGREKELWYVRLAPPLTDEFDYHVSVTTPYVLTESSAEDWTAFLNKHLLGSDAKRQALADLLKYGNEQLNWMEFVFQAYHHFQYDAIFLAGIPDVPASMPHSPARDETEDEACGADVDDPTLRLKFTQVQRRAIANMCPELSSRLRLPEKNQRTIELRQSELNRVVAAARRVLAVTKGSRQIALKKIIAAAESARKQSASAATVYQFKITLAGSNPPIWRRIQTQDCTLADLHHQIQGAMGWLDSHLHEFDVAGERYIAPSPFGIDPMEGDALDASTVRLSELIGGRRKFRCEYLYDFGDGWEHKIDLEQVGPAEAKARYPRCIDGASACPPEDCGGILGFYDFVAAITDRKHPEHRDMMEWNGPFKPDAFDTKTATLRMRRSAR